MELTPSSLLDLARSPGGKKMIRYSMVSVIAVIVNLIVLTFCAGVLRITAGWSNIIAVAVSAVPSYYLNRTWAWGKTGRSHLMKEVVPFWALAFLGLAVSTWAVSVTGHWAKHRFSHPVYTLLLDVANVGAFGTLWIAKFIIFNKVMFVHHEEDLEDVPALDGRTGVPT